MKQGKALLVALLIIALLASAQTQVLVQRRQEKLHTAGDAGSGATSLARMDSYALALLLGGLRGPLVMFLWTQSEQQKSSRQLEGVETQIEWIRLLQPEFDTVHLFQIWNKAYNLSVQMAALPNKYATILDAIEYGRSVNFERPDNVNILSAIGQLYSDKLGTSQEKDYYRRRVREDSLYSPARAKAGVSGTRRLSMPVLLDEQHNLLPRYTHPTMTPPLSREIPTPESYNGADLQFLEAYQPFPYGVSTHALGYNYYKRSQVLQDLTRQRHIQMSDMVVDTRPALSLQTWGAEEWERGRRAEITAAGGRASGERLKLEAVTAAIPVGASAFAAGASPATDAAYAEAVYSYRRTIQLYADAAAEFIRHINNPQYAQDSQRYQWQLNQMAAFRQFIQADLSWLEAQRQSGEQRKSSLASAADSYRKAIRSFKLMHLRYYVQDNFRPIIFPPGTTQANVDRLSEVQIDSALRQLAQLNAKQGGDMYAEDVSEYDSYINRAEKRLAGISQ